MIFYKSKLSFSIYSKFALDEIYLFFGICMISENMSLDPLLEQMCNTFMQNNEFVEVYLLLEVESRNLLKVYSANVYYNCVGQRKKLATTFSKIFSRIVRKAELPDLTSFAMNIVNRGFSELDQRVLDYFEGVTENNMEFSLYVEYTNGSLSSFIYQNDIEGIKTMLFDRLDILRSHESISRTRLSNFCRIFNNEFQLLYIESEMCIAHI